MANKRAKLTKRVDSKVFTNTAKKTKKINLGAQPTRGGIRL